MLKISSCPRLFLIVELRPADLFWRIQIYLCQDLFSQYPNKNHVICKNKTSNSHRSTSFEDSCGLFAALPCLPSQELSPHFSLCSFIQKSVWPAHRITIPLQVIASHKMYNLRPLTQSGFSVLTNFCFSRFGSPSRLASLKPCVIP